MEANSSNEKVYRQIIYCRRKFDEEIDNHNLKKAKDILNKMVTKLGENNSDVIKAQIEIDLLEMDDDIL